MKDRILRSWTNRFKLCTFLIASTLTMALRAADQPGGEAVVADPVVMTVNSSR